MKKFNNFNNRGYPKKYYVYRNNGVFDPRVDNSRELMASFTFRTVVADPGEDPERLLRRFKRVIENAGVLAEIRKREFFKTPGQKSRERHQKAVKNALKRKAKMDRMIDYDSKKPMNRPHNPRREHNHSESRGTEVRK